MILTRGRLAVLAVTAAALVAPQAAAAQAQPYGTNESGTFYNILPAGANGTDTLAQLIQFETAKTRPPHNDDQLGMYSALTTASTRRSTAHSCSI